MDKSKIKRLIIARAAQAVHNIESIIKGQGPSELTSKGEKQAELLGDKIANIGYNFNKIYTSQHDDNDRGIKTAEIIKTKLRDSKIEIIKTGSFSEMNLGTWENKRLNQIDANIFNKRFFSSIQFDKRQIDWYQEDLGETQGDVILRTFPKLLQILKNESESDILIVGHAAVNRIIINTLRCLKEKKLSINKIIEIDESLSEYIEQGKQYKNFQENASYHEIKIEDGELIDISENNIPYKKDFDENERDFKIDECKYCSSIRLKVVDKDLIGDFTKVQYICNNYLCDFRIKTGYKYVEEVIEDSIALEKIEDIWIKEKFNEATQMASKIEPGFNESLIDFLTKLSLAFKPDFTLISWRNVNSIGQVNFEKEPCASNFGFTTSNKEFHDKVLNMIYLWKKSTFKELFETEESNADDIEVFHRVVNIADDIKSIEGLSKGNEYFRQFLRLKTLLLIGIKKPFKNKNSEHLFRAVIDICLPYEESKLKESIEYFIKKIRKGETYFNQYLELIEFPSQCIECTGTCQNEILYSELQAPTLGDDDSSKIHAHAEEVIDKIEEKVVDQLGYNRSQIWTLRYFRTSEPYFSFFLTDKKKEKIREIKLGSGGSEESKKTFEANWEALKELKHEEAGILGDTLQFGVPEFVPSAWSDIRETQLENSRQEARKHKKNRPREIEWSKVEHYFYGGKYMDYTAIPLIINRTYWGLVMFFYREFEKNFDPGLFYIRNIQALNLVSQYKKELEDAITLDFLSYSMKIMLDEKRDKNNRGDSLNQLASQSGFLPSIEITDDIDNSVENLIAEKEGNFYIFSPRHNYKFGKIILAREGSAFIFRFRQPKLSIPLSIEHVCETLVNYEEWALERRTLVTNQEKFIGLLRDFHHIILKYIIYSIQYASEAKSPEGKELTEYVKKRGEYIDRLIGKIGKIIPKKSQKGKLTIDLLDTINSFKRNGFLIGRLRAANWDIFDSKNWSEQLKEWQNFFEIESEGNFEIDAYSGQIETIFENAIDNCFKFGLYSAYADEFEELEDKISSSDGLEYVDLEDREEELCEKQLELKKRFKIEIKIGTQNGSGKISIYGEGYGSNIDQDSLDKMKTQFPKESKGFGIWLMNFVMDELDGGFEVKAIPSQHKEGFNNVEYIFFFTLDKSGGDNGKKNNDR